MNRQVKFRRPARIWVRYYDPFDGRMLCEQGLCYDARKSAEGYYTKYVKKFKAAIGQIFSDVLQGRIPTVTIAFSYYL